MFELVLRADEALVEPLTEQLIEGHLGLVLRDHVQVKGEQLRQPFIAREADQQQDIGTERGGNRERTMDLSLSCHYRTPPGFSFQTLRTLSVVEQEETTDADVCIGL